MRLVRFVYLAPLAAMLASATLVAQSGEWLMYSGQYSAQRYSPLTQITPATVGRLRPAWVYQPPGTGSLEATPVVVNGVMYVTAGPTMVAALDLRSGKPLWEWTRPIAPSILNLGFPRVNRGGATWLTGSYDPQLKLLYWGTGNPGPDWNGDSRLGDNFGTASLVALDVETGKLRWTFQFTPHDVHDWDANQIPVLVDTEINGRARQVVVAANRNAFFYVLDRATGEYLLGAPYSKQTWAKGLDEHGRPILIPGMEPSEK